MNVKVIEQYKGYFLRFYPMIGETAIEKDGHVIHTIENPNRRKGFIKAKEYINENLTNDR